jgi:hypothetical protein
MGRMKNFLIVPTVMVVLFAAVDCFALFGSGAELDVSHINKDLIGKEVDGWLFPENNPFIYIRLIDFKRGGVIPCW